LLQIGDCNAENDDKSEKLVPYIANPNNSGYVWITYNDLTPFSTTGMMGVGFGESPNDRTFQVGESL
jgi:hypothetical protein